MNFQNRRGATGPYRGCGSVDIVVTEENLHAVFLFNPAVDRPASKTPNPKAYGYADKIHGANQHR